VSPKIFQNRLESPLRTLRLIIQPASTRLRRAASLRRHPNQSPAQTTDAPAVYSTPESSSDFDAANGPSPSEDAFTPVQAEPQSESSTEPPGDSPPPQAMPEPSQPHIEGLQFNPPKNQLKWLKFSIIGIVVLLIAAYLAIDSGAIGSGINLPFHVFKQKSANPAPAAGTTNKQSVSSTPAVPAGFKEYKLAGTSLTFAAPAAWGDPTSDSEAGYSKRGTNIQPDGTYAYIVDFATNKNVEIAVTSDKFLPPVRAVFYYDFLQWCTGTNDEKFYQSVLRFTTANKVDTPTTITCDQGPLANAQKLDSKTLLQTKVPDAAGKVLGDIYTKNLTNAALPVIRIKDTSMTNGPGIKQLLGTVQITAAPSNSTSNQ
jgi:hypothetical protein